MYLLCNLFSVSLDFYFRAKKKEANKFFTPVSLLRDFNTLLSYPPCGSPHIVF